MKKLTFKFFNIHFKLVPKNILFSIYKGKIIFITTVNLQFLYISKFDQKFRNILSNSLNTIDAQPLFWILYLRILKFKSYLSRNSGSELIFDFLQFASKNDKSVFLLGGTAKSNFLACNYISKNYTCKVSGFSPEYSALPFPAHTTQVLFQEVTAFKPDILLVGFGAPKQEFWINDNLSYLNQLGIKYVAGIGGTFDMLAGLVVPAPLFIKSIGLEWIWRFLQEPFTRIRPVAQRLHVVPSLLFQRVFHAKIDSIDFDNE